MFLIGVLVFSPLGLTLLNHAWPQAFPLAKWLRNETLQGFIRESASPSLSAASVGDAGWQRGVAANFNHNFAGREFLIRLTCEGWYRVFRRSPLATVDVVLGTDDFIFSENLLRTHCLVRTEPGTWDSLGRRLRELQEACVRRDIAFVLVISPSKEAVMPERVPAPWKRLCDPRPRPYYDFVQAMREHGVRYVDAHALAVQERQNLKGEVFPKGGIHWGQEIALTAGNAVLTEWRAQGLKVEPMEHEELIMTDMPVGEDSDMMALMNLAIPWRYSVVQVPIRKSGEPGVKRHAVVVGGSFMHRTAVQLSASGQFSKVDHFFYYDLEKQSYVDGGLADRRRLAGKLDFAKEVFAADCLLLEINEDGMNPVSSAYLASFVDDALRHLGNEP